MTAPTIAPAVRDELRYIDDALIGLLAIAAFGPAEQATATSVEQACAAEVLLFRLRAARTAVRNLAVSYGFESPVRQAFTSAEGLRPGGPVLPPEPLTGEEPTPGSAAAICSVASESRGSVVEATAGASTGREKSPVRGSRPVQQGRSSGLDPIAPGVGSGGGVAAHAAVADADVPGVLPGCGGRANGAVGAATFDLPPTPTVPSFDGGPRVQYGLADYARPRYFEGGRRLIGRVEMNDQTRPNPNPIGVPKPPLLPKPGPPPPPPPKVAGLLPNP